ncbi:MAG TPA: hypothetical protein VHF26_15280 [Trebonia sp.]|nr:hypothetical protein [Trebonia sp.]
MALFVIVNSSAANGGVSTPSSAGSTLSCGDVWTGAGGTNDWGTAANWSAGVPGTTVDACVPNGAAVTIAGAPASVAELTIETGSVLDVAGASGTLAVTSGLRNDGTLVIGGSDAASDPVLTLGGPSPTPGP